MKNARRLYARLNFRLCFFFLLFSPLPQPLFLFIVIFDVCSFLFAITSTWLRFSLFFHFVLWFFHTDTAVAVHTYVVDVGSVCWSTIEIHLKVKAEISLFWSDGILHWIWYHDCHCISHRHDSLFSIKTASFNKRRLKSAYLIPLDRPTHPILQFICTQTELSMLYVYVGMLSLRVPSRSTILNQASSSSTPFHVSIGIPVFIVIDGGEVTIFSEQTSFICDFVHEKDGRERERKRRQPYRKNHWMRSTQHLCVALLCEHISNLCVFLFHGTWKLCVYVVYGFGSRFLVFHIYHVE